MAYHNLYIFTTTFIVTFTLIGGKQVSRPNFITKDEWNIARNQIATAAPKDMKSYNEAHQLPDNVETGTIGTQNFWKDNIWPNGRIPYTINPNLYDATRIEVAKAFEDYHFKTCIRFVPREATDEAYVDILHDDTVPCGRATICRTGGPQTVKLGGPCHDARTIIHELGHTICMLHEQDREDRDEYVQFEGCDSTPKQESPRWTNPSFYDYNSVMQYDGGWPGACLQAKKDIPNKLFGNPGRLSVLDVEKINARYNCTGCLSYRWKFFDQLTPDDHLEPASSDGVNEPHYICRFYVKGEIVVGKASVSMKSCWLPFETSEVGSMGSQKFEVLTNPDQVKFQWVQMSKGGQLPVGSVAGGRKTTTGMYGELPETYYIAQCNFKGLITVGALHEFSRRMFVPWGGRAWECDTFEVLTCNDA